MPFCEAALVTYALVFASVDRPSNMQPVKCMTSQAQCEFSAGVANEAFAAAKRASGYGPHYFAKCEPQPRKPGSEPDAYAERDCSVG